MKMLKGLGLVVVALCANLGLGGCADLTGAGALRDQLDAMREQSRADLDSWEQRLADARASEGDQGVIRAAETAVAVSRARHAALDAAIAGTDAVLHEAREPSDPIGHVVGWVAPWLPEPVRTPMVLGAAALAGFGRARQLKRGMTSIAVSLREAMNQDEAFARNFKDKADILRAIQTPTARRVVDETDPARRLLRLPV